MKKYAVGDVVMVPVTIVAVHPQGYKYGLHANGGPNMPPHSSPTAEEIAEAKTERADTIVAEISGPFEFDAHGHVHFSADADL